MLGSRQYVRLDVWLYPLWRGELEDLLTISSLAGRQIPAAWVSAVFPIEYSRILFIVYCHFLVLFRMHSLQTMHGGCISCKTSQRPKRPPGLKSLTAASSPSHSPPSPYQ